MRKTISKLVSISLVFVSCLLFFACGKQNNGGNKNNNTTTVNELSAESGVSASGTFEGGSALKAELHAATASKARRLFRQSTSLTTVPRLPFSTLRLQKAAKRFSLTAK